MPKKIGSASLALVVVAGSVVVFGGSAWAQSKFCPTTSTGISNGQQFTVNQIQQISGKCTNPSLAGAFSGAALDSQAIGDLAGSSTLTETVTAGQAIEERQNAPLTCQPGEALVDGICRPARVREIAPPRAVSNAPALAPPAAPAPERVSHTPTVDLSFSKAVAQAPPPIYDQSFRIGSWAQGFGDYEHRTGSQSILFNCCTSVPGNTIIPMTLDASSTTSSGGFVGGVDITKRRLSGPQDGFVAGLLGGYIWNNITVNTSAFSSDPTKLANGSNRTTAHIDGPSLGLYATYFNGPFSNDFLIKNDFLSLDESWSGILGFGTCNAAICNGAPPNFSAATAYANPNLGSGSTNLNQLTIYDNVNYKIPLYERIAIEPTGGLLYVNSSYSSSAAALGLSDGYIFRVQGGARLRVDSMLGDTRMTTLLTGRIFDDVVVHGNNIQAGSFGPSGNILSDQGKVQGEAIASVNFDLGRGLSASVEGDVYGGQGVFGAGGKATIRMRW